MVKSLNSQSEGKWFETSIGRKVGVRKESERTGVGGELAENRSRGRRIVGVREEG